METKLKANKADTQRLTLKERDKDDQQWYKDELDKLDKISFARSDFSSELIDKYRNMKINFDVYNNKLNMDEYEYLTKPLGEEVGELPADFSNKDIISGKLKVLQGLEMSRPFSWKVTAVNEEVTSRKEEEETNRMKQFVISQIMQPIREQLEAKQLEQLEGRKPNKQEQQQIQQQIEEELQAATPDQVKQYMIRDHQDPVEVMAHQLLEYLIKKEDIERKFDKGWKNSIVTAREIYFITSVNGETILKVVNPLRFDHDDSADLEFIEDGEWGVVEFRMNPSEIMKTFDLDDGEIDYIYDKSIRHNFSNIDIDHEFNFDERYDEDDNTIRVLHGVWKSLVKIGFLTYFDEKTGSIEMMRVDETYKFNDENGDINIEWKWIPIVLQGYKIGDDIYKEMGALAEQFRSEDDLYYCKLPFYGAVYDNDNSEAVSFVDRMKVDQHYYNVIMYRIQLLMASDQGKKVLMNVNVIPKSSGIDIKKWKYYADALNVMFFNPNEEANRGVAMEAGSIAKEIDLSLVSDIQKYIEIANFIEERCGKSVGITRQVEGQITPNEAVRNTQQNITQSSKILEPYFALHNHVKRNVLQGILENAKITYANSPKKKLSYVLDDMSIQILNLDADLLLLSDYGIFVSNSMKAFEAKRLIEQLAHAAMQNQTIELSDVIKVIKSEGMQETEELLMLAEQKRREADAKQNQEQNAHEQKMAEEARNFLREEWAHEMEMMEREEELKTDREIKKQAMLSIGFNEDKDIDNDNQLDVLEVAKAGIDADIKIRKQELDEEKFEQSKKEHSEKMKLEDKKLKKINKKT